MMKNKFLHVASELYLSKGENAFALLTFGITEL